MYNQDFNFKKSQFEIKILGQIEKKLEGHFENMNINDNGDFTILTGIIKDKAFLFFILAKIKKLNLTLISVKPKNE